ncbi:hypothetical protein I552_8491 [Mycobacterium xenopi 3993]|nr:hypothetical protein I552_8491 [Mycobacterium xenopi 3993]
MVPQRTGRGGGADDHVVAGGPPRRDNLFNLENFVAREVAMPATDSSAPTVAGGRL